MRRLRIRRARSSSRSVTRARFWSVRSSLRSASFFCTLKRATPAASSKIARRASGLADSTASMRPCSITE